MTCPPGRNAAAGAGRCHPQRCERGDLSARARQFPQPVVFTNGVFDLLHTGHLFYLQQARALVSTIPQREVNALLGLADWGYRFTSLLALEPPDSLLRLQRREFYRLQTPLSHSVSCTIALPQADGSRRNTDLRILDISDPRNPVIGTRLVREWDGAEHVITVLKDGFDWQGRRYKSLSAVARDITGTQWNGYRFFGLRPTRGSAA